MQLLKFWFRSRASLELEVVALRHQLKVLKRRSRPRSRHRKFKAGDRIFWVWLFRILPKCVNFISLVKPVTLIRWHNQGFKLYWSWRSRRKTNGRGLSTEIRELILRMHRDNPLWGSGRIHGKLLKLGFKISAVSYTHLFSSESAPRPLYGAFLVKKFKQGGPSFFFVSFFVRFESLFLRPDRGFAHAGARRSCQGWPLYQPCGILQPC